MLTCEYVQELPDSWKVTPEVRSIYRQNHRIAGVIKQALKQSL